MANKHGPRTAIWRELFQATAVLPNILCLGAILRKKMRFGSGSGAVEK